METFSALLAICAGNSPVPGEFPTQRPVTRSFDVYFDLRPNKRLSKQSRGWWFETQSRPLWRHRNVYKPPRDNNSTRNINAFKSEIEPIFQEIGISNNEAMICGDYNINLLKINGAHFSEFVDTMLGHSFYPKLTLPTRLNRSSGATLIDNIYCKLSQTLTTSAGIILD